MPEPPFAALTDTMVSTTIGTVGSRWRAAVTSWGAVDPWPPADVTRLDWWVGADDRWHVPATEPSCRQRRLRGTPVVETAVRVPGGDAVQRVYAVADHGGLTVVEVENRSPLPFAVAVSRRDLLASRAATPVAAHDGAALAAGVPATGTLYPVAHRTTLRLALAHDRARTGAAVAALGSLPSAEQVTRGWETLVARGTRLVVPDDDLAAALVAARCALVLEGPPPAADDPAGYLLAVAEQSRAGDDTALESAAVAQAAERLARRHRPRGHVRRRRSVAPLPWEVDAGLRAAAEVLRRAGDHRAAADVELAWARLAPVAPAAAAPPAVALAGPRRLARAAAALVAPTPGGADLFPELPAEWHGLGVEAHRVVVPAGEVSVAVRWHGARPALLWECSAPMALTATGFDPAWSVGPEAGGRGEALVGNQSALQVSELHRRGADP